MDIDTIIDAEISSIIKWPWVITIKIFGLKWKITITQADFMKQFPWVRDVIKRIVAKITGGLKVTGGVTIRA